MKASTRYRLDDLFRRLFPWGWCARNRFVNRRRLRRRDRPARRFLRFMRRRYGHEERVLAGLARQWKIGIINEWFVVYFPEANRVKFMRRNSCFRSKPWEVHHWDLVTKDANLDAIKFAEKVDP